MKKVKYCSNTLKIIDSFYIFFWKRSSAMFLNEMDIKNIV